MTSTMRWTCLAVLVALLGAGCGKDDQPTEGQPPADKLNPGDEVDTDKLDKNETESVSNRWYSEAMEARDAGNWTVAREKFQATFEQFPTTWAGQMSALHLGNHLYEQDTEPALALKCLEAGITRAVDQQQERQLRQRIDELRRKSTTAPVGRPDTPDFPLKHTVRRGDTLVGIAKKYGLKHPDLGLQYEVLYFSNWNNTGLRTRDNLMPGKTIIVDNTMPEIVVDKSDFVLMLTYKGETKMTFKIGTGKPTSETPTGTFVIDEKVKDPPFKEYAFGHPENVVGKYWLAFRNTAEHNGYGIHGTRYPESIGHKASNGCIRMTNQDITIMQRYVPRGTKVTIRE